MTLVLLTPIGLDAGCWEGMALAHDSVAKHTFPGFGGRERAREQPTMASLADEVAASYEPPLDLVGVSLGGMVAQHVTIRHQARVRSLMVCCTGANADPATMHARAEAAERDGMAGVLQETLERWFTPGFLSSQPEHSGVAYARRTLLKREVLPEHVAAAVAALTSGDLTLTTGLHIPVDSGVAAAFLR